jgi:hypothetical protein
MLRKSWTRDWYQSDGTLLHDLFSYMAISVKGGELKFYELGICKILNMEPWVSFTSWWYFFFNLESPVIHLYATRLSHTKLYILPTDGTYVFLFAEQIAIIEYNWFLKCVKNVDCELKIGSLNIILLYIAPLLLPHFYLNVTFTIKRSGGALSSMKGRKYSRSPLFADSVSAVSFNRGSPRTENLRN